MNLLHIAEGWSKSLGLLEVSEENKRLSEERISICAICPHAKESSILKFFRDDAKELGAIVCGKCGCPVNEKTLVNDEKCPEGNW